MKAPMPHGVIWSTDTRQEQRFRDRAPSPSGVLSQPRVQNLHRIIHHPPVLRLEYGRGRLPPLQLPPPVAQSLGLPILRYPEPPRVP